MTALDDPSLPLRTSPFHRITSTHKIYHNSSYSVTISTVHKTQCTPLPPPPSSVGQFALPFPPRPLAFGAAAARSSTLPVLTRRLAGCSVSSPTAAPRRHAAHCSRAAPPPPCIRPSLLFRPPAISTAHHRLPHHRWSFLPPPLHHVVAVISCRSSPSGRCRRCYGRTGAGRGAVALWNGAAWRCQPRRQR